MNQGKYVFAQLINFLSAHGFDRGVFHYAGNKCIYRNLFTERKLFNYLQILREIGHVPFAKAELINKLFALHLPS